MMIVFMLAAAATISSFVDGNKLHAACSTNNGFCIAYSVAVADSIEIYQNSKSLPRLICMPKNASQGQVADVAAKYLRDHPEDRSDAAAGLVAQSLKIAFPCKK